MAKRKEREKQVINGQIAYILCSVCYFEYEYRRDEHCTDERYEYQHVFMLIYPIYFRLRDNYRLRIIAKRQNAVH